jgi:hypothetical protein
MSCGRLGRGLFKMYINVVTEESHETQGTIRNSVHVPTRYLLGGRELSERVITCAKAQ